MSWTISSALIARNRLETYPYTNLVASHNDFRASAAALTLAARQHHLSSATGTDQPSTTRHTLASLPPSQATPDTTATTTTANNTRSTTLSTTKLYTELAELRRADSDKATLITQQEATIKNLTEEYLSSETSLQSYQEVIAFHKREIASLQASLVHTKSVLDQTTANEQHLVDRLISEKTSMMDQIVEMTTLVEALQAELRLTKTLLESYESGNAPSLSSPLGSSPSSHSFLSSATVIPRQLLSISKPHTADITCLFIPPAAQSTLITCSSDSTCKALDLSPPIPRQTQTYVSSTTQPLTCCTASPTGLIATGSVDKAVRVYSGANTSKPTVLQGHSGKVSALCFVDSSTLISASHDRTLRIWAVGGGKSTMKNTLHCGSIPNSLTASSSMGGVASGHADGCVRFWDASTATKVLEMPTMHQGQCTSVQYSPTDGYTLASTGRDNAVRILDSRVCAVVMNLTDPKYRVNYNWSNAEFSPDGENIVTGSGKEVFIWSVRGGKVERILKGHSDYVERVVWGSGERQVVSAGKDGSVIVWE